MLSSKYIPIKEEEFLGCKQLIPKIEALIKNNKKNVIAIHGASGSGKSSLVEYITKKFNLKKIMIDAYFVKSGKNISEILKNVQYSFYVKSCIVFSDFENILQDNIYHNVIKQGISLQPHNVIFTLNSDFVKKFESSFGDIEVHLFQIENVSIPDISNHLKTIAKNEKIKLNSKKIKSIMKHLPDIRKCIDNIGHHDEKDELCTESSQQIAKYMNSKNFKIINQFDMFQSIPMIHESYMKYTQKENIQQIANAISICDILQTYIYKTQKWQLSEFPIMYLFLICSIYFKQTAYKTENFPFGKVLSKMSNKQTKLNTFSKLFKKYNCETPNQLYLCKNLSKTCKLLSNQFL